MDDQENRSGRQPEDAAGARQESSHGHHHHHSHHSRRKPSLRRKWKRYYHKHKKSMRICGALLAIAACCGLFWAASYEKVPAPKKSAANTAPAVTETAATEDIGEGALYVGLLRDEKPYLLTHHVVPQYMKADPAVSLPEIIKMHGGQTQRLDTDLPALLQFDLGLLMSSGAIRSAGVEISETESFEASVYAPLDSSGEAAFYHLKTGTTYHYCLTLKRPGGETTRIYGTFQTEDTPRILGIDGIANVRDIGGWKTVDGKRLRQGLLYRGGEIDGAVEPGYKLTDKGILEMTQTLGIRSDFDLREKADALPGTYIIGSIRHTYYPVYLYQEVFYEEQAEVVRSLFSALAKPENYPVYLHCTYGRDRTGTVCYLLEALLGLSDEDLLREYELSALYYREENRALLTPLTEGLAAYPGGTTRQKAESFLLSVGVTPEEIDSIRSIFLEEQP